MSNRTAVAASRHLYTKIMSAILSKTDRKSKKILSDLARHMGGNVIALTDTQFEDLALGMLMNKVKTNQLVSRYVIMNKLKKRER